MVLDRESMVAVVAAYSSQLNACSEHGLICHKFEFDFGDS
jgi:hypothetical protein